MAEGAAQKIIMFVDIDGVLNNYDLHMAMPRSFGDDFANAHKDAAPLSPIAVGFINRICYENPEIRLVCSSDWRMDGKEAIEQYFLDAHKMLERASEIANIPYEIRFDDTNVRSWRTYPDLSFDNPRGLAIDKWLEDYGQKDQLYIILDDDDDFFEWQKDFLVQTNGNVGFNLDDLIKVDDLLNNMKYGQEHQKQQQLRLDI